MRTARNQESGHVSKELAKRIITSDSEHDEMVTDKMKRLQVSFGSERLGVLSNAVAAENPK